MATPVVKWIGGKRQLVPELLKYVPFGFEHYYEPFCGGAALFFALRDIYVAESNRDHLHDANPHLINLYTQIRDNVEGVLAVSRELAKDRSEAAYYALRAKFNAKGYTPVEQAAAFIFINRGGFNGLWRENKKGDCNVPYGGFRAGCQAGKAALVDEDNLLAVSAVLQGVELTCGDFASAVEGAQVGDLVYCFAPGSMVLTQNEEYKSIESVGEGEKLWGGRTVKQTVRRRYTGVVRRIKVQGSPWMASVTADHPVLSIPGRRVGTRQDTRTVATLVAEMKLRPASALTKGDYVLLPTGDSDRQAAVHWHKFLASAATQAKKLKFDAGSGEGLGRLLGYYAAEGHLVWQPNGHASSAVWSFSRHEREYIVDVAALCKHIFGIDAVVRVGCPHAAVTQVHLHSTVAATFIGALVPGQVRSTNPDRRYTLRLSQVLMTAPHAVQMELLKGWLRGDGGLQRRGAGKAKLTGTGAAKHMVLQFYRIAQRLGLRPSWKTRESIGFGFSGKAADVYFSVAEDIEKLGFDPGPRKRQSCAQRRFVNGYLAVRIKEITDLDYCGEVYNLDVDGDSLLVVDGIVSHNCDPPYVPASATADFTSYTADGFGDSQQMRLEAYARLLVLRGVHVIASNSDTPRTRAIWPTDRWTLHEVQARRAVNCDGTKRGKVGELIIVGRTA